MPSALPVDATDHIKKTLLEAFNRSAELPRQGLAQLCVSEWFELCRFRGVGLRPVTDDPDLVAFLILHCRMGWVIYFNRHMSQDRMKRAICHELAEHALAEKHECAECSQVRQNWHRIAEQMVNDIFLE